jgi:parallel beta-helix repeat protein
MLWLAATSPAWGAELVVDQQHTKAADTNAGTADAPLKTVGRAVALVQPGDTILIKAGTYGESIEVTTSGTTKDRITIKAAPGQRVVLSGAERITGWHRCTRDEARGHPKFENLYVAEIDRRPAEVCQGNRRLQVSRWPNQGRFSPQGGDPQTLTDAEHLTQPAGFWIGATLNVRIEKIKSVRSGRITSYDPEKHMLTVDRARDAALVPGKDLYWIENAVAAISGPGQYAIDTSTKPGRIYLWPLDGADPNETLVQFARRDRVVTWAAGVSYLTFDGLEVAFATESALGSSAKDGHDIEIVGCTLHHGGRAGVGLYNQSNVTVRHCLATASEYGIILGTSKNILIEENELFANGADALSVSHQSDNIRLVRNYFHDQWWDNHPDGFQVYFTVTNLVVDSNLIMNTGQGVSTGQVDGARFVNNVFVGQHHTGVSLGHDSTDNCQFLNNTVAYSGFKAMSFSGRNGVIRNNILLTGGDGGLATVRGENTQVDYNLYWRAEGAKADVPPGSDQHSKYADPKFRVAPPLVGRSAFALQQWDPGQRKLSLCTPGKFYPMGSAFGQTFQVGDVVEVDLDGRPRRVTEVTDEYVAFDPPLAQLHHYGWNLMVNWKDRRTFAWDLRLAEDSPGRRMGQDGGDVGSSLDMQAYMRGDFNGDGRRDLPDLPGDLRRP